MWVFPKELWTVAMSLSIAQGGNSKMPLNSSFWDEFLMKEWRQHETRDATLWWNLMVSFTQKRIPVTFLLQGNFQASLIAHNVCHFFRVLSQYAIIVAAGVTKSMSFSFAYDHNNRINWDEYQNKAIDFKRTQGHLMFSNTREK
jgi:hypothetical protein